MTEVNRQTYPDVLNALVQVTRHMIAAADQVDLGAMRTLCAEFEALAPVLEPTAYQRGGGLNLRGQATFLRAVDEFVSTLRTLDRREDAR